MRHGFSLVELSIVLVILGLLVGGVLTGQSLIRAAELRSVTTEFTKYQAAANTFRDKYFALPGDMTNATSFWGAAHATPATCLATAGTGTQTCNGDGDGRIDTAAAANQYGELYTFWQHLANAGLIEGTYSGRTGSGSVSHSVMGDNVPSAKLTNSAWSAYSMPNYAGNTELFAYDYQNVLHLGASTTAHLTYRQNLKPEEAWSIDQKMDDGRPGRGAVMALRNICTDSTGVSDLDADYVLTNTDAVCRIVFARAF